MSYTLQEANQELFQRYKVIIGAYTATRAPDSLAEDPRLSLSNLLWMCDTGIAQGDSLPIDKISRWLGFIQGCLAMRGLILVDEEREVSRPLFHAAYRAQTGAVPETLTNDSR